MFYETLPIKNQSPTTNAGFVVVRKRDERIVFGPISNRDRADHICAIRNSNDAARVALALAAGRDIFVQAITNPDDGHDMLKWQRAPHGAEIAKLDGGWWASVEQGMPDGMYELRIHYGDKQVGEPVLAFSMAHAQQRTLAVYAARGML